MLECNLQLPPALGGHLVLIRLLRPANRCEWLTCVWPRGFSACHLFLRARVASSFFTVYKKHRCRAASSELTPHPPASSANQWDVSNGERRKSRGTCCLSRGHVWWNTFIWFLTHCLVAGNARQMCWCFRLLWCLRAELNFITKSCWGESPFFFFFLNCCRVLNLNRGRLRRSVLQEMKIIGNEDNRQIRVTDMKVLEGE